MIKYFFSFYKIQVFLAEKILKITEWVANMPSECCFNFLSTPLIVNSNWSMAL